MKHAHLMTAVAMAVAVAAPLSAQADTTTHRTKASTHGQNDASTGRSGHRRHHQYTQAELEATVKVSKDSAQTIALAKVPNGTVSEAELEHEHGTTVWSFDITQPNKSGVEEVLVSAITGKVIYKVHESAAHERAEARADSTKH